MSSDIDAHVQQLTDLRHRLHRMAEVSGSESNTAKAVKDFLQQEAKPDELYTGIGETGMVAAYKGETEGPHIMLRCELDGLPISDDIDTAYRSQTEGVGHKCGHDGHMSIICGVAMLLAKERPPAGRVSLLFQPAEETGQGAQRMLDDETFQQVKPDCCFALHNLPGYEKHQIIVREGPFAAASVGLEIRLKGETSHAAHPEEGRSPALAMAQLVQSFSAVPQFYSPLDQASKVTVISAGLGEKAFGTSPAKATVRATLRTYEDEHLEKLKQRCLSMARGLADTYGLSMEHHWEEEFAATRNDAQAVAVIRKAAEQQGFSLLEKETPFSWSEDFGRFIKATGGAMFGLGTGTGHAALHAESYDFEDEVITTGIRMFMQIIEEVSG